MRRVQVPEYFRRDGTRVRSHTRRPPKRRVSIPTQRAQSGNRIKRSRSASDSVPPLSVGRRPMRKKGKDRINEAADFCMATINDGMMEAAADKIAGRVSLDTWNVLRRRWGRFRCKWLARLAQRILDTKTRIHEIVADVAMLKWGNPLHTPERLFAHQLIKNLPIPVVDDHCIVTARGLRLTGICLCWIEEIPLTKCACFQPLALEFTKERVKSLLVASGNDWIKEVLNQA